MKAAVMRSMSATTFPAILSAPLLSYSASPTGTPATGIPWGSLGSRNGIPMRLLAASPVTSAWGAHTSNLSTRAMRLIPLIPSKNSSTASNTSPGGPMA